MPRVFISYRRQDTLAVTGRIHDKLSERFGRANVFMDFDNIPLGIDFREHLNRSLQDCDVLLVVIGPNWTGKVAGVDTSRLMNPSDFVRLEVQVALERNIPVIPVLVGRTSMPEEGDLPVELQPLLYRQSATVDVGRDFHVHTDRLIEGIRRVEAWMAEVRAAPDRSKDPPGETEASETNEADGKSTGRTATHHFDLPPVEDGEPASVLSGAERLRPTELSDEPASTENALGDPGHEGGRVHSADLGTKHIEQDGDSASEGTPTGTASDSIERPKGQALAAEAGAEKPVPSLQPTPRLPPGIDRNRFLAVGGRAVADLEHDEDGEPLPSHLIVGDGRDRHSSDGEGGSDHEGPAAAHAGPASAPVSRTTHPHKGTATELRGVGFFEFLLGPNYRMWVTLLVFLALLFLLLIVA